jgi:DNA-binding IscR family transcriptional regulator
MQLTTKGRYAVTAMLDLASNNAGKPITLATHSFAATEVYVFIDRFNDLR